MYGTTFGKWMRRRQRQGHTAARSFSKLLRPPRAATAAKLDCRISDWEGSVSGYSDSTPAVACCNVFPDFVEPCLPSQVTSSGRADWIHEIKHDGLACHHVQTCTDREQPTRKIVRRKQIIRTSRAHSKKWHAAGCYLPSKWSGWTVRKRPKRATLPRSQEPLLAPLSRQGCDCD